MKITTKYISDYAFQSISEFGAMVDIDMTPGQTRKHQSPVELVLSALSACVSVDLVQILKKRKRTVNALTVAAEGTRAKEQPRALTHIKLVFTLDSPDAEQPEFEKMGNLAATRYCSVAASLNAEVAHEFVIIR